MTAPALLGRQGRSRARRAAELRAEGSSPWPCRRPLALRGERPRAGARCETAGGGKRPGPCKASTPAGGLGRAKGKPRGDGPVQVWGEGYRAGESLWRIHPDMARRLQVERHFDSNLLVMSGISSCSAVRPRQPSPYTWQQRAAGWRGAQPSPHTGTGRERMSPSAVRVSTCQLPLRLPTLSLVGSIASEACTSAVLPLP